MVVVWRSLSFAVAAVLAAPAAFAADLPAVKPLSPPPPVTVNWTGLYGGGEIGGVYNTARYNRPFTAGFSDTSIGNIDPRPVYSLYGGFNLQVLPWAVLGVEYSHTWLRDATFREFGAAFDNLYDARRIEALTGRIGFLAKPDTMIYAKGGGARISVRYFPPFSTTLAQQTLDGVQVGGGIESLVLPNVAVRGEVTYTRADQLVLNQGFDRYRPEFVMFNVGAAYKFDAPFGWGASAAVADRGATVWPSMITKAPPRDPIVQSWTGIEAGGFLSINGNKVTYNDTLAGEQGPYTSLNVGGGWFAAANVQFQRIVAGFEFSDNHETSNFYKAEGSGGVVNFHRFAEISRVLAVTARVGFLTTPDTLLYIKGGPAMLWMLTDPNFFNAVAPNITGSQVYSGYQGGVGAETYVLPRVSVRVEGLYTRTANTVTFNGVVPNQITLQPSIVSATIGVALHL